MSATGHVSMWARISRRVKRLGDQSFIVVWVAILGGMFVGPFLPGPWKWLGVGWVVLLVATVLLFVAMVAVLMFDSIFRPASGVLAKVIREDREDADRARDEIKARGFDPDDPDLAAKMGLSPHFEWPDPVKWGVGRVLARFALKRGFIAGFILLSCAVVLNPLLSSWWGVVVGVGLLGTLAVWVCFLVFWVVDGLRTGGWGDAAFGVGLLVLTGVGVLLAWLFGDFNFLSGLL